MSAHLLPGKEEADVPGHPARVFEHLGLQPEAERAQVIVPEFVGQPGTALQGLVPVRLEVVDGAAAILAQLVGKSIDLYFGLSGLSVSAANGGTTATFSAFQVRAAT